ncbi:addiction module protein [Candidatus Sumerlaeota bacterium]|nr:addiction module protein [Candidatus Sumerlaeota bacterium]
MAIILPLDKMSIGEKISTMEKIWDDLCRGVEEIPSPPWHERILQKREEDEKNGAESLIDWETAKKNIRDSLQ